MVQLKPKPLRIVLNGRSVRLREATIADCPFIVSLRCDSQLSEFIHPTTPSVAAQENWLLDYASRMNDYYFICEDAEGTSCGTVRVPSVHGSTFEVGSWVFIPDGPIGASVQAWLLAYRFGFDLLGCEFATFDVRRLNERVWRFHERYWSRREREDADNINYRLDRAAYSRMWSRYSRLVACPGHLDWMQEVHRAE
jgi:hypothetical protein